MTVLSQLLQNIPVCCSPCQGFHDGEFNTGRLKVENRSIVFGYPIKGLYSRVIIVGANTGVSHNVN